MGKSGNWVTREKKKSVLSFKEKKKKTDLIVGTGGAVTPLKVQEAVDAFQNHQALARISLDLITSLRYKQEKQRREAWSIRKRRGVNMNRGEWMRRIGFAVM